MCKCIYHKSDKSDRIIPIKMKTNTKLGLNEEQIDNCLCFLVQLLGWVLIVVSFSTSIGTIALFRIPQKQPSTDVLQTKCFLFTGKHLC